MSWKMAIILELWRSWEECIISGENRIYKFHSKDILKIRFTSRCIRAGNGQRANCMSSGNVGVLGKYTPASINEELTLFIFFKS
jgi:hypothetical protein